MVELQSPCDRLMHILHPKATIFSLFPFIVVLHAMSQCLRALDLPALMLVLRAPAKPPGVVFLWKLHR